MSRTPHLEWSHKQSRILTANGTASQLYTPERGYPFLPDELPHHHLLNNTTHTAFYKNNDDQSHGACTPIIGAWNRPLFVGGWEHSTSDAETVYNIQTSRLFVDLRVPTTKPAFSKRPDNSKAGLRSYARQHVFGGCTMLRYEESGGNEDRSRRRPVCTRHHFIDWNFVGVGRSRPNKWFVEFKNDKDGGGARIGDGGGVGARTGDVWKEWSFARDDYGQCYYWERWERLEEGRPDLVLAMRKREDDSGGGRDGIVVAVGNHFNYLFDRVLTGKEQKYSSVTNLVDLVDMALQNDDFVTAQSYLTIEGGHGTIKSGWVIDTAIQSWKEGEQLFTPKNVRVIGDSVEESIVIWNNEKWDVWECSLKSVAELERVLRFGDLNASRL